MDMTDVSEHPILFTGQMVRAILDGNKTETRRVVKPQSMSSVVSHRCPYGHTGDHLWVRETWSTANSYDGPCICYKADGYRRYLICESYPVDYEKYPNAGRDAWLWWASDLEKGIEGRWRPSIHMPRWASRITLRVCSITIERLQDITECSAKAEGVDVIPDAPAALSHRTSFAGLWDKINKRQGFSWESNPWVWVVKFQPL